MVPEVHRLRRSSDFTEVTRSGKRGRAGVVVVHVLRSHNPQASAPRVGFVVSKAVGSSVQRHAVARRLRHAVRDRVRTWPAGARVVIRALPGATQRTWSALMVDIDTALDQAGLPSS